MGRRYHAAAAVRSGKTVYVIEFGGLKSSNTPLAATTILQMCKYMVVGGGGAVFLPFLTVHLMNTNDLLYIDGWSEHGSKVNHD